MTGSMAVDLTAGAAVDARTGDDQVLAVRARGLTYRFGEFTAVDRVSFTIERGEIFGFLGSNGSGKTTTMKMLTGLLAPTSGEALLFGDERVAAWGVLFWLFTFAVVVIYEEPTLRQQFGEEYRTYCKNVPRWVPRVIPYKPSY